MDSSKVVRTIQLVKTKGISEIIVSLNLFERIDMPMTSDNYTRFPKLKSPFVRDKNEEGHLTVTDKVQDGYEWVFDDDSVLAVEKVDGENIAVYIDEQGNISEILTREGNLVEPFDDPTNSYIVKGVLDAYRRGWLDNLDAGELHYGELLGPTVQGNPYDWNEHMWVPFEYLQNNVYYKSWGDYPKTFGVISDWFKDNLLPLFYARMHNIEFSDLPEEAYVEGIIFTHPDGRKAKLRRDMFDWYEGPRHGER